MRPPRRHRPGFTIVELLIAGVIAAMVVTVLAVSMTQVVQAKNISKERLDAFMRADIARRLRLISKRGAAGGKEGGSLWKTDEFRAVICRPVDQRHECAKCLLGGAGGAILQRGDGHRVAPSGHAASSLSRWPVFSSA